MFIWMDVFFLSFSGDFFKDSLPEAELYILARILHDWTDERCVELLQRIYKACKPGLSISECERDERPFFFFSHLLEMRADCIPEKSVLLTLIKVRHKAANSITEQRGQQKKNEKVGMVNCVTVPAYRRKWGLKADLGSDLAYASH